MMQIRSRSILSLLAAVSRIGATTLDASASTQAIGNSYYGTQQIGKVSSYRSYIARITSGSGGTILRAADVRYYAATSGASLTIASGSLTTSGYTESPTAPNTAIGKRGRMKVSGEDDYYNGSWYGL